MKRTVYTLAVLALACGALYALAGYWIAPRIIERKLVATIARNTDLTLVAESVTVNPFTLTLSLDDVTLFRPQNTPVVSIDTIDARIQAASLVTGTLILGDVVVRTLEIADSRRQEPVFTLPSVTTDALAIGSSETAISAGTLQLDSPRLRLQRGPAGSLNLPYELTSLLPDPAAAGPAGSRFAVSDGALEFSDQRARTPVRLDIEDIDGTITRRTLDRQTATAISLQGRVSGTGSVELTAEWFPSRPRSATRVQFSVRDIEMADISPYIAEMTGRGVLAGRMDLTAELEIDEAELDLTNSFAIRNLQLGRRNADAGDRHLPVELAAALLEDKDGLIEMRVPVARRFMGRDASLTTFVSHALVDYLAALAATPFETLAELAGRPDLDLGRFAFPPGSANLTDDNRVKVAVLQQALEMRPGLGLTVFPGFNPATDRGALSRQQILLHVNLATSTGLPGQSAAAIDFDEPKVRVVLDEFATNRLPESQLAAIAARFPDRDTPHFRAVFDALVDNETVATSVLERLARYRAQSIINELVNSGIDKSRIRRAEEILPAGPDVDVGSTVRLEVRATGAARVTP